MNKFIFPIGGRAPRLICDEVWANGFRGRYKQHYISIERDSPRSDWYILIQAKDGGYVYDGWWQDSKNQDVGAAVMQGLRGAKLI